jgi:hypothetical protein
MPKKGSSSKSSKKKQTYSDEYIHYIQQFVENGIASSFFLGSGKATIKGSEWVKIVVSLTYGFSLYARVPAGGSITVDMRNPALIAFLSQLAAGGVNVQGTFEGVEYVIVDDRE